MNKSGSDSARMKKWLLVILLLPALLLLIYIITPSELVFDETREVNIPQEQANRILGALDSWKKIFLIDNKEIANDSSFEFNSSELEFAGGAYGNYALRWNNEGKKVPFLVRVLPRTDSTIWINANFTTATSAHPLKRLQSYVSTKNMASNTAALLDSLASYLNTIENNSRKMIVRSTVKDSSYLSMQFFSSEYPSTVEVYKRVDSLQLYIQKQGARITGKPMLNSKKAGNTGFMNMVALPIDRDINATPPFMLKKMIMGNILVYEFTGGPYATQRSFATMEDFVSDHHLSSPAIPYVTFETDRRSEQDSAKWISRIYYPIY